MFLIVLLVLIAFLVIAIFVIRTERRKTVVASTNECPLCGQSKHMNEAKLLYGHAVCKRCYYSFANRRQFAFFLDMLGTMQSFSQV